MIFLERRLVVPNPAVFQRSPRQEETWIVQKFIPKYSGIAFSYPFDLWEFSKATIKRDNQYFDIWHQSYPFNPKTKKLRYWGNDAEHGECFGSRLLPVWDLLSYEQQQILNYREIYGVYPIYEPDYYGSMQILFLKKDFLTIETRNNLERFYEYSEGGQHFVCAFTKSPEKLQNIQGLTILFSHWIKDQV